MPGESHRSAGIARLGLLVAVFALTAGGLAALTFGFSTDRGGREAPRDEPPRSAQLLAVSQAAPAPAAWMRTLGGALAERANAALILPGERLMLAGSTYLPNVPLAKAALYITHGDGELIDQRMLAGNGDNEILALLAGDGSVFAAGRFDYTVGVARFLETGEPVWRRTFAGDSAGVAYDMVFSDNGHLLVAGATNAGQRGVLLRMDQQGDLVSQTGFNGGPAYGVVSDGANGAIIGGQDGEGAVIYRIDPTGRRKWTLDIDELRTDRIDRLKATSDGAFLAAGSRQNRGGEVVAAMIVKFNSAGEVLWRRSFDDVQINALAGRADEILLAGQVDGVGGDDVQMWLAAITESGDTLWENQFGGTRFDTIQDILLGPEREVILAGYTFSIGEGESDIWVARLTDDLRLPGDAAFTGERRAPPYASALTDDAPELTPIGNETRSVPRAPTAPAAPSADTATPAVAATPEPVAPKPPAPAEPPPPPRYVCQLDCQTSNAARIPYPADLELTGSFSSTDAVVAEAMLQHVQTCADTGGEARPNRPDPVCRRVP